MIKYIIVSIAKGYGGYPIDKYNCGLKTDLTFDPNLNYAKKFNSKEEAICFLKDLHKERKDYRFGGNFFVNEIVCL